MRGAAESRSSRWLRRPTLCAAALAAWAGIASAQSISASPLRADLSVEEPVAVITLRNEDPRHPTLIQARPSAWTVVDGVDRYDRTRELVVSPSVFRLEPGEAQLIRLSLRGRADARVERLYRLFLQQVPDEAQRSRRSGNVQLLFTFGVPVFVAPSDNPNPAPEIVWRIERDSAGAYRLRATNHGSAHLKLAGVSMPTSVGDLGIVSAATYLLPGTERVWGFKTAVPLPTGPVDLTVLSSDGTSSVVRAVAAE